MYHWFWRFVQLFASKVKQLWRELQRSAPEAAPLQRAKTIREGLFTSSQEASRSRILLHRFSKYIKIAPRANDNAITSHSLLLGSKLG